MDSCKPAPICQDASYVFSDNSRILSNSTFYEGNATSHDWVLEAGKIFNTNETGGELALTLTEKGGGSRLSSTRYVHYGTITARLKTGRWAGVITAFITMSDVHDEIDWEFPGDTITEGQSNMFWQGVIPTPSLGETHKDISDTFSNYHDYTIDWQPETLTWSIDGKVVRTLKRSDTIDEKTGIAHYPSTPSRVQLSLWPAGIPGAAQGTVEWAGGMINWEDPDYKSAGHFYALVKSVTVKCSNQETGADLTSYVYVNGTNGQPAVKYTNATTLLNAAGPTVAFSGYHGVIAVLTAVFMIFAHAL